MIQALNASFFGQPLSIGNDTIMTILLIAEAVVCVVLMALLIYILCRKPSGSQQDLEEYYAYGMKSTSPESRGAQSGKGDKGSAGARSSASNGAGSQNKKSGQVGIIAVVGANKSGKGKSASATGGPKRPVALMHVWPWSIVEPKRSCLGIVGFVLSLLSLLLPVLFLASIPISAVAIKKDRAHQKFALAGLLIGLIVLLLWAAGATYVFGIQDGIPYLKGLLSKIGINF